MKKRMIAVVALLVLLLYISVQAAESRVAVPLPTLTFSRSRADCFAECESGNSSDRLSATLTLWQGSTWVDSWSSSGTGRVTISESCDVVRGKDYKLVLTYTINSVAQPSVSVTGTCP